MSTILDALKRVQDESDPRSLHESVTKSGPPRPPRRGGSRFPLIALLLFFVLGAGAWFVWPGQESLLAYLPLGKDAESSSQDSRVAAATSPNSPAPIAPLKPGTRLSPQERQQLQKERQQRAANDQAEMRRRERERRAEASRLVAQAPAVKPQAPPVSERVADPGKQATTASSSKRETSAPKVPRRRTTPSRQSPARGATPEPRAARPQPQEYRTEPLIETGFALEPAPRSKPGSVVEREASGQTLPAVTIEVVRWHPEPKRREVTLLIDGSRSVEAREGDTVSGMLIHRIDPGTVEVHHGDREHLLSLLD